MKTYQGMDGSRLEELVGQFPHARIAVLGDFFLDKYLDVDPALAEVSLETGKTAHQVVSIRHSPGAAGTVVSNLAALGAKDLHAIGFSGDDGESYDLRNDLAALHCRCEHLYRDGRRRTPTYLKPRDKGNPHLNGEHSRYDTKNRDETSRDMEERIIRALDALLPRLDAVIVMDQVEEENRGAITTAVAAAVADRAQHSANVVFWADSRRRIRRFRHAIIKPNQFEAIGLENAPPNAEVALAELENAVIKLRAITQAPVCATRGADGMVLSDPEPMLVPGVRLPGPIDATGAGDSATAGAVLALTAGADLAEAALIGNLVASITVEQLATTGTAHPHELVPRFALWKSQQFQ
jgi:rfaE bifunctional protein kinase chain/domain